MASEGGDTDCSRSCSNSVGVVSGEVGEQVYVLICNQEINIVYLLHKLVIRLGQGL